MVNYSKEKVLQLKRPFHHRHSHLGDRKKMIIYRNFDSSGELSTPKSIVQINEVGQHVNHVLNHGLNIIHESIIYGNFESPRESSPLQNQWSKLMREGINM